MPIVRIEIVGPKSPEYTRAVLLGVRDAVRCELGAPDERIASRLIQIPAETVDLPSCRTERFTVVEVSLYDGRTEAQKAAFADAVREHLARNPGIEANEIVVILRDLSPIDLNVLPGTADS